MEILVEIVKNLLVIVIISSFLELLVPEGNIKPFVRLSIGLFVLVAVLSPALNYFYHQPNIQVSFWDYQVDRGIEQKIKSSGDKINQQMLNQGQDLMKEKVEGQISAMAMLVPGVNQVHTQVWIDDRGSINKIQLLVSPRTEKGITEVERVGVFSNNSSPKVENQKEVQNKILQVLQNLYGIDQSNIEIEFEGG